MATVETRTSRPITMMPERSSTTTRAVWSGSTFSCSISVTRRIILPVYFAGICRVTVAGSVGSAVSAPMKSLIADAIRFDVVKSGLRRDRRRERMSFILNAISRSIMAPLGTRPLVGTPRVILAASPSAENPAIATDPWARA